MKHLVLVMCLVASVASADKFTKHNDVWKLGEQIGSTHHGCASPKAAKVFKDFLDLDPTFYMGDDGAEFKVTRPTDDGKGTHETSYRAKITVDHTMAEWANTPNGDNQQIRIKADFSPMNWSSDGKHPRAYIQLISDYDPDKTGTHPNVCSEVWYGSVISL